MVTFLSQREADKALKQEQLELKRKKVEASISAIKEQTRATIELARSLNEAIRYLADRISSKGNSEVNCECLTLSKFSYPSFHELG